MDSHEYITNNNCLSVSGGGGVSKSSLFCRQSSTRWIPTGEQVRILRDLYYNCGVRSPSAEQIQKITAKLQQYGKIEGKNVFYWFQNHKARERQKKRLNVDCPNSSTTKFSTTTMSPGVSPPCSPGLYGVGQMGSSGCHGSMFMEMPWMYHCAPAEQKPVAFGSHEIETLPLFPIHSQDQEEEEDQEVACDDHLHPITFTTNFGGYHLHDGHTGSGGGASLELSLSSYNCDPPGST